MSKVQKTTNEHLVTELEALNEDGKYDRIIAKAKHYWYHDYKSEATMPKVELYKDLGTFPELNEIKKAVMDGDYDEPADETDKNMLRRSLSENCSPEMAERLRKKLGL